MTGMIYKWHWYMEAGVWKYICSISTPINSFQNICIFSSLCRLINSESPSPKHRIQMVPVVIKIRAFRHLIDRSFDCIARNQRTIDMIT